MRRPRFVTANGRYASPRHIAYLRDYMTRTPGASDAQITQYRQESIVDALPLPSGDATRRHAVDL